MSNPLQRIHKRVVVDYLANAFRPRAPLVDPGSKASLLPPLEDDRLVVPLTWAATHRNYPDANLGDALSPILVSALSGLSIAYHRFESPTERLAVVGTIGHKFAGGTVHFWGTGFNYARSRNDQPQFYDLPKDTVLKVHALRGPISAWRLRKLGVPVDPIYGDPVWFLPSLFPANPEKRYELGVIVHVSELQASQATAQVNPKLKRYRIPPDLESQIKLMHTFVPPHLEAIIQLIKEITACKRIVSTSLHGLVIAEAYGIPCAYLHTGGQGGSMASLVEQNGVDYRIRDFYRGVGLWERYVYRQEKDKRTNWDHIMNVIPQHWEPIDWSPEALLERFPLPLAFNPLSGEPFDGKALLQRIRF